MYLVKHIFVALCLLNAVASWQIILERAIVKHVKTEVLYFNASVYKYNHTTFAANCYVMALLEVPSNTMIEIKLFGFYSNAYKQLPLLIQRNMCDTFDLEYKFIKNEIKGHFPDKCPLKRNELYYVKEFVPSTTHFPRCPWKMTNYYVDFSIILRGEVILNMEVYVRTDTIDDYYQ